MRMLKCHLFVQAVAGCCLCERCLPRVAPAEVGVKPLPAWCCRMHLADGWMRSALPCLCSGSPSPRQVTPVTPQVWRKQMLVLGGQSPRATRPSAVQGALALPLELG